MRFGTRRRGHGAQATYAAVLDGRHLWLHLDREGSAALRSPDGTTVPLQGEVSDLVALLPPGEQAHDVVLDGDPVGVAPFAEGSPTRVPVAPDGVSRFVLQRADDGRLQVRREALAPTAVLESVGLRGGEVHLTMSPPGPLAAGTHLRLLDTDDRLLDELPVTAHEGHVEALIGVGDLPAGYFGVVRLALGTDAQWMRIRRRANDLADAHHAVLLPELHDPDEPGEAPRARLRWNPDAFLVVRVLEPTERGGPHASVTPIGAGS